MQYREGIEVIEEHLLEHRNEWRFEELRKLHYCLCEKCVEDKHEHPELEEEFLKLKAIAEVREIADEIRKDEVSKIESVKREIVEESNLPIRNVRASEDELYGFFIEVEIFGTVGEALEEWLRLIDVVKVKDLGIPIYPKILGKFNVLPGEFGKLIGLGLSKMKVPLRLEKPMDITKVISQERGE